MKNLAVHALSVLFVSSLAAAVSLPSNLINGERSLESALLSRSQSAKFLYARHDRGGGHNHGGDNGGGDNGGNNDGGNNNNGGDNGGNNGGDNNNNGGDNNNNGDNNGGNNDNNNGGGDPQSSDTIDPSQIQDALNNDGTSGDGSEAGIAPSLTSNNNFINFCLTQNVPITNGKQVQDGSCNPTPMGRIVAKDKMPSCKFQFPKNGEIIQANQQFTIKMAVQNFDTGFFANPTTNYFGAPQTVNDQGFLKGHSHVVIEPMDSFTAGNPLNPLDFAFFKGLNSAAVDGVLSTDVTDGLSPGVYKLSSINSSVNHQPALVAVAQHGSLDDTVYFRVVDNNNGGNNNNNNNGDNNNNGNNGGNNNNNDNNDRKQDNPFQ